MGADAVADSSSSGSWRWPAAAVLAYWAAAAFGVLFLARAILAGCGGYEPAAAAAGVALLPLGLLGGLLVARVSSGGEAGRLPPTAAGAGATLGALAFAAAFGLSGPAGRPALEYPSACSAEDALFASGEAQSLARVLVVGGGRPDLVRELLARGAAEIDVVEPDPAVEKSLAGALSSEDRAAMFSPRVRKRSADPLRYLQTHSGAPYDLAFLALPAPTSVATGRMYSAEFHRALAARLAPFGLVALAAPRDVEGSLHWLSRIMATLDEVYKESAALPAGRRVRFMAAPIQGVATLDPDKAARRASERTMPGGGSAPAASEEDFRKILDRERARKFTADLLDRELAPETLRSQRMFLDYLRIPRAGAPLWRTGSIDAALGTPIWAYFAALWLMFMVGGMAARRSGTGGPGGSPGRLALVLAAFLTGLSCFGAGFLLLFVYQAWTGLLAGHLPFLAAVFAAAWGLGTAGAGRLAGFLAAGPRRALISLGFVWLLVLLLLAALPGLPAGLTSAGQIAALALAAVGFMGGLELGALARLDLKPTAIGGAAGTGALVAALLAAGAFLPALGPAPGFLVLLGAKAVELGILAAGTGRPAEGETEATRGEAEAP